VAQAWDHRTPERLKGSWLVIFCHEKWESLHGFAKKYIYIIWINNDKHGLNHIYIYILHIWIYHDFPG
jgi:hypothetical protein